MRQKYVSLVNWPPKYCGFAAHAFFVLFIFLCFFLSLLTWAAFTALLPTCRWAWQQLTKEIAHLAPVLTYNEGAKGLEQNKELYDIVASKWKRRGRPTTKGKSILFNNALGIRVGSGHSRKINKNGHGRARRKRWIETVHTHKKDIQNASEQNERRKLS